MDFTRENIECRACFYQATNKYVVRCVVFSTVTNCALLGMYDFSVVNDQLNRISAGVRYVNGEIIAAYSLKNAVAQAFEALFTAIFPVESVSYRQAEMIRLVYNRMCRCKHTGQDLRTDHKPHERLLRCSVHCVRMDLL